MNISHTASGFWFIFNDAGGTVAKGFKSWKLAQAFLVSKGWPV